MTVPTLNELPDKPQELTPQEILQHRVYNLLVLPIDSMGTLPYMTAKKLSEYLHADVELIGDALLVLESNGDVISCAGSKLWEGIE